jgi:hypothetical protein
MKNSFLIFFSLFAVGFSFAQRGIMLEAGGPAGYISVNYISNRIELDPNSSVRVRVGYGTYRLNGINGKFHPDIIVPIGLMYRHTRFLRWSVGAGITVSGIQRYAGNDLKTVWGIAGFENISFQFIDKEHFQANVTAYLLNEKQKPFRPWGGLSFTYLF